MDSNQSGAVGGIIWGPFPESLTHFGASRWLQSHKRGPFWAIFWPSLTPPANLVNFFGLFCKKGHFPQQIWLKTCIWSPKHILDLNPRASKWAVPCPKILLRRGVGPLKGLPFQLGILQSRVLFLYRASGAWPCWSGSDCFLEKC